MPKLPKGVTFRGLLPQPTAEPRTEEDFAALRLPSRTYISKSFPLRFSVADLGQPARYVRRVFVRGDGENTEPDEVVDWEKQVVYVSEKGKVQIELQVARSAGRLRRIRLEKVSMSQDGNKLTRLAEFDRDEAAQLAALFKGLDDIPIEGDRTVLVDDELVQDLAADPHAFARLYAADPVRFRQFIESDVSAADLVAVAYRRQEVGEFRRLLSDNAHFDQAAESAGGPERAWQVFLERNPWILGVGLSGQLLTSWDRDKLERTVAGSSVAGPGKRVDALMQTNGRLQMLAFAEIKHHRTDLLHNEHYRSGCWAPSHDLSGGVTQVQQTVHHAIETIKERLAVTDSGGAETGEVAYLIQPRSYLVVGHLGQLTGTSGGVHADKHRSFEVFRRSLTNPEVLTFDELLARAEWSVALSEGQQSG